MNIMNIIIIQIQVISRCLSLSGTIFEYITRIMSYIYHLQLEAASCRRNWCKDGHNDATRSDLAVYPAWHQVQPTIR